MRTTVLTLLIASMLAACSPTLDVGAGLENSWQLVTGSVDGRDLDSIDGFPVTLVIDSEGAGGRAACNSYFGSYEVTGARITFSGLGQTEMACSPSDVMDLESTYLGALARVETYLIDGDSLTLEGEDVTLAFEIIAPVPEAALTGTVWVLDGLVSGDAVSSVAGEPATLELFTDGSFIGSTGCRTLTGAYVITGSEVVFTEMSASGDCPSSLAGQDSQVVSVLGDGFRAEVDGQTLTLTSMGEEGLIYKARSG